MFNTIINEVWVIIQGIFLFVIGNAPMLSGFVLPPVIEYVNKEVKTENEKVFYSLLICIVVAVFTKWNSLTYGNPEEVVAAIGIIFTESYLVFKFYFKKSNVRKKIQEIFQIVNHDEDQGCQDFQGPSPSPMLPVDNYPIR